MEEYKEMKTLLTAYLLLTSFSGAFRCVDTLYIYIGEPAPRVGTVRVAFHIPLRLSVAPAALLYYLYIGRLLPFVWRQCVLVSRVPCQHRRRARRSCILRSVACRGQRVSGRSAEAVVAKVFCYLYYCRRYLRQSIPL